MTHTSPPTDDERWNPVQVAAFMQMQYQDARNAMLEGRFGESEYDPVKRKLTVSANAVRAVKRKRETDRARKRKNRRRKGPTRP